MLFDGVMVFTVISSKWTLKAIIDGERNVHRHCGGLVTDWPHLLSLSLSPSRLPALSMPPNVPVAFLKVPVMP